uniref:Ubiquitin-like modifier-activating enzyme ATG7 n=1 Tax=Caenorhabditis tropicalis TaxID=1561998 RepID=A0A1I7UCR6_9PELO
MATFVPFITRLDTAFWSTVNKKSFTIGSLTNLRSQLQHNDTVGSECSLSLNHESFNSIENSKDLTISGSLLLFNTAEGFKAAATAENKQKLLEAEALKIWNAITSHSWLQNPKLLSTFSIISFADLKKFKYYSLTCVPAFVYPKDIEQEINTVSNYNLDDASLLSYHKKTSSPVFLFSKKSSTILEIFDLKNQSSPDDVVIVIADPSPVPNTAGWVVRNVLAAVAHLHPSWRHCHVISLRSSGSVGIKFKWALPDEQNELTVPKAVGWDKTPYSVNLRDELDPVKLMDKSVNLNVSLIKWRLHPDIKLERYSELKVLIFGAGTLGCNIARSLSGWGIKHFSFVDNSTVSYSNPVRQSLCEFEDARLERGKAETAAAALKRSYPSIQANAYKLTVPMPGHTIDEKDEAELEKDVKKIETLVKEHDVVFLALDSREARWLPTVLATKHRKIAISVAIGFDTYVVIRHGIGLRKDSVPHESTSEAVPYSQLSCYFCSDVTAPGNSTVDRTLDQQCTVSRPGTSFIASGNACELIASVLQYPDPLQTPASPDDNTTMLGSVPHQIRGFLSKFQQILPIVKRFERCVGCGDAIAQQYQQNGWKFVRDVMNSSSKLEKVSGLDELQDSVNAIDIDFEEDDEE